MFSILKNQDATCEDMAKAFVKAEAFEKQLKDEQAKAYENLMDIQKDFLDPGKKGSKALKDARAAFEDVTIRLDACRHGQQQLNERIADRLPVEAKNRTEKIHSEYADLENQKKTKFREFLRVAAQAVAIHEEINWREIFHDDRGNYSERLPSLKIDAHNLQDDDLVCFMKEVEQQRKKSSVKKYADSFKAKQDHLSEELYKLEKLLDEYDPETEVENLLNSFRPKEVKPETTEVDHEGYKKSSPVLSYSQGVGVAY